MNQYAADPRMFILPADPKKYIRTPAGILVTLIKAAEGAIALMWSFRMLECLRLLIDGSKNTWPIGLLKDLLPKEIGKLLLPDALPDGGEIGKWLSVTAAVCILAALFCLAAEGVASVILTYSLYGAGILVVTRKVLWIVAIVLLITAVLSYIWLIYGIVTNLLGFDRYIRPMTITSCSLLLLGFRISYHRDAAVVMKAVEFECRIGYKELSVDAAKLGRNAVIFGVAFAAAFVALGIFLGWDKPVAYLPLMLSVKYFAVYSCWGEFQRRHM